MAAPTGTVTFLFAEIEGSALEFEEQSEPNRLCLDQYEPLLRRAIDQNHGFVFKSVDGLFCSAFDSASKALQASITAQEAIASEDWPVSFKRLVRMALHTGAAEFRNSGYFGPPLDRVSRLLASGHGSQILLSKVTHELVRDELPAECLLLDLGEHRLRDLGRPERIFQLQHPASPTEFPPLKSLSSPSLLNNLPAQGTSFIGREKEIAVVNQLLEGARLLSLTGAGGSGKTRLALQVAADRLEKYPDGVWLVELAPLSDANLLTSTVARVLGISEQLGQPIEQTLINGIKQKRLLVLLDSCEHIATACSQLAASIFQACPGVILLATSREALGIEGERTYRVPSLALPDTNKPSTPQSVSQFDAVRLFIDRAMLVNLDFALSLQNAPALAEICARLDGIPLAIELASARVRSLRVEDINETLSERFRHLVGTNRAALPRHQTLRAVIEWSHDLLAPGGKMLLNRLSVFSGGWTFDAAQSVGLNANSGGDNIAGTLADLVEMSLVIADKQSGTTRYRLHETVRHFSAERLRASGEIDEIKTRHRDAFLEFAEEAEPQVRGIDRRHWMDLLETEHDNLRAALAWCEEEPDGVEPGLRLAGALERFWYLRGFWSEGREHLAKALGRTGAQEGTLAQAGALLGAGRLTYAQGDYPAAQEALAKSLKLYRDHGEKNGIAASLQLSGVLAMRQANYSEALSQLEECLELTNQLGDVRGAAAQMLNLGIVAINTGDFDSARAKCEAALSLCRELGDKNMIATALSNLAEVAYCQSDFDRSQELQQEGLDLYREMGARIGIAYALFGLGIVALARNDIEPAKQYLVESLRLQRELVNKVGISEGLERMASLNLAQGQATRSTQLWGSAEALREAIGAPKPPYQRQAYDQKIEHARLALGDNAFAEAWEKGRAMALDQAVDLALSD